MNSVQEAGEVRSGVGTRARGYPSRNSLLMGIMHPLKSERSGSSTALSRRQGFKRILVAVDGSAVSLRAADQAARMAKQDGAQLIALHVVPTPPFESVGEFGEYYNIARKEAKKWLKEVEGVAEGYEIPLKVEVIVGAYSVVDTIIGYAETSSVDLIVSGTRGRTPSATMRIGSVASGLVEFAGCAVLVMR
jgi:nucleotide-binding universal stress UspA family protein